MYNSKDILLIAGIPSLVFSGFATGAAVLVAGNSVLGDIAVVGRQTTSGGKPVDGKSGSGPFVRREAKGFNELLKFGCADLNVLDAYIDFSCYAHRHRLASS